MRYLILLACLAGCTPTYLPGTRNAPLFTEGGEAQISGYLSAAGAEAQLGYSLTDNIAVIGGYSYASQKKTNASGTDYTRKNGYGEIGLGLYGRSRSVRYEVFAGYGMGETTSNDVYYFFANDFGQGVETVSTGKMQRIFFQPSIGTNNRSTNLAFTPRVSWVSFSEFTSQGITREPNASEKSTLFLEPAATLKFHLAGNLFCVMQLGLAMPMSGEPFFEFQSLQGSVGLQIDTGGLRTNVFK